MLAISDTSLRIDCAKAERQTVCATTGLWFASVISPEITDADRDPVPDGRITETWQGKVSIAAAFEGRA